MKTCAKYNAINLAEVCVLRRTGSQLKGTLHIIIYRDACFNTDSEGRNWHLSGDPFAQHCALCAVQTLETVYIECARST